MRNRRIGERLTPGTADAWIAAWEAEAASEGLRHRAAYWDATWAWITERRTRRLQDQ
jgi:hypothetical protein